MVYHCHLHWNLTRISYGGFKLHVHSCKVLCEKVGHNEPMALDTKSEVCVVQKFVVIAQGGCCIESTDPLLN